MILKLSTWLLAALAAAALFAGCGSSTSTTASSQTTSTAAGTPQLPANLQKAVESCEHGVQSQPTISASAKAKLLGVCKKAASGGQAGLQKVAHEVCVEIINSSHVPSGAQKERALAVCNSGAIK